MQHLLHGGAVRHQRLSGISVSDFLHEIIQQDAVRTPGSGSIQGYDISSHLHQGIHFPHCRSYVNRTVRILFFYNSYYGKLHISFNFFNIFPAVSPDTTGASFLCSLCHSSHDKGRVQRLIRKCLTGYNKLLIYLTYFL